MNIMEVAIDQGKAKDQGVQVFYDKEKTCGAVLKQMHSAAYRAALAKHAARFKKETDLYKKDAVKLEKVTRLITAHAITDTVIVSIFGFDIPVPGGEGKFSPLESNKGNILRLMSMPEFDSIYSWVCTCANDLDTFIVTDQGAWEEIGKKLQET